MRERLILIDERAAELDCSIRWNVGANNCSQKSERRNSQKFQYTIGAGERDVSLEKAKGAFVPESALHI